MSRTRIGTIRDFDYEGPISHEPIPEVTGKICFVKIGDEEFVEIKTLGPVEETYSDEDLQVIRITKHAFVQIQSMWNTFSRDNVAT